MHLLPVTVYSIVRIRTLYRTGRRSYRGTYQVPVKYDLRPVYDRYQIDIRISYKIYKSSFRSLSGLRIVSYDPRDRTIPLLLLGSQQQQRIVRTTPSLVSLTGGQAVSVLYVLTVLSVEITSLQNLL